jgi:UDP-N-acetylmuramoyl-tripeptide--D-alanyl-D-alanine ligase
MFAKLLPWLLFGFALSLFHFHRLRHYARYLQEEDYIPRRFLSWVVSKCYFDSRGSVLLLITGVFSLYTQAFIFSGLLAVMGVLGIVFIEGNPVHSGKLRLKFTRRMERIFSLACFFCLFTEIFTAWAFQDLSLWILSQTVQIQCTPLFLALAVFLLSFDEKKRQGEYSREAQALLEKIQPYVIGITGSYGKTSTKHALDHILNQSLAPTFSPAKGINTDMGIVREIREKLKPGHRFAAIEMAAYQQGSIARLCRLTPPHAAIVTSVGSAHLERYGSLETIYQTKSEIAQALEGQGILVCSSDQEACRRIGKEYPAETTLFYGFTDELGPLDCRVSVRSASEKGTEFSVFWKGREFKAFAPMFGKPAISNLAGAFTMACALGANPELVIASMKHLHPVSNRQVVEKTKTQTYIHDAYNSNPIGFKCALETLKDLPGKRKILMTPGMIELGDIQAKENYEIAKISAGICDLAILVGDTNREALRSGMCEGGMNTKSIYDCATRDQAFAFLKKMQKEGDVILIENDLSDIYEGIMYL